MKKKAIVNGEARAERISEILHQLGDDHNVSYRRTWKNNVWLDGYTVLPKDSKAVMPTVYAGSESDKELAVMILKSIQSVIAPFDIEQVFKREYVKRHLRARLIPDNDINRAGLEQSGILSLPFDIPGLLITLEISLEADMDGMASIQLTGKHLERVGMTLSEAYDIAVDNMGEMSVVMSMRDMMLEMIPGELSDEDKAEILPDSIPMYILTTRDKHYGAACLLSKVALRKLTDALGTSNYYILPSSIHEVIAIPKDDLYDVSVLMDMVQDVNSTQVEVQEKLADAVYQHTVEGISRVA